jgi:hypothetical protein
MPGQKIFHGLGQGNSVVRVLRQVEKEVMGFLRSLPRYHLDTLRSFDEGPEVTSFGYRAGHGLVKDGVV